MADNNYFTKQTDEAIERFILSTDVKERHEIFDKEIRPAFEELISNLIYVYRFFTIGDPDTLKRECLSSLYEIIPKFDPTRGTKGFSYFNISAKNWFIQKAKESNRKNKIENELHVDVDHESIANDGSFAIEPHEKLIEDRERWILFYEAIDSWKDRLTKKSEKHVLEAVIFIMKNSDLVPIYSKKAVFLYLRELTGLNTKQIVVNLKKIKSLYNEWLEEYNESGGEREDGYDDGRSFPRNSW